MAELQDLPPGWDCKLDARSGRYYYINHYTKTTTWEDPRTRHRHFHGAPKYFTSGVQNEYIPLQHGSSDSRRNYVYPSQTSPIPAFQMPAHMSPKKVPLQDMKPRMSPLTVKSTKVQDSSLTALTDTDEAVAKIAAMFPTVTDTHIRLLLKKYHNREALVISALQVEKYPITTPGPFATPPPQRNIHHPGTHVPLHMTPPLGFRANSRGGSPIYRPGSGSNSTYTGSPRIGDGYRSSPRPHSSPKLKLSCRYMKSIFPQADETIILEVLQNNDNNIQKASDILKEMGYTKKDAVKVAQQKLDAKKEEERKEEEERETKPPSPQIRMKTMEEKKKMKADLQEKHKDVAEHLITIALESVNFDEDRANQILQIMEQEDTQANNKKLEEDQQNAEIDFTSIPSTSSANLPVSQSRQSLKSILKERPDKEKEKSFSRVIEEHGSELSYTSKHLTSTNGPNPNNIKGTNEKLLLEEYVKWQGSNPNIRRGPQSLAKGSNPSFLSGRSYQPCGPNSELRKGPKFGLAKGSIFSQLKTVVVGESRGK